MAQAVEVVPILSRLHQTLFSDNAIYGSAIKILVSKEVRVSKQVEVGRNYSAVNLEMREKKSTINENYEEWNRRNTGNF